MLTGSTPTAPQVHFYDFLARAMVRTVTLSEWPTALAACAAAPIVAVGGASGGVRLAAHPFDASDNALFAPADMARYLALSSYQCRLCMLLPKSPDHHPSPGDARQQCALPSLRGRQPALHRLGGRGRAVEPAPLLRRAPTARAMAATASATRQPRRPLPPRPRRPCRLCALGHMMWTRRGADGTFCGVCTCKHVEGCAIPRDIAHERCCVHAPSHQDASGLKRCLKCYGCMRVGHHELRGRGDGPTIGSVITSRQ